MSTAPRLILDHECKQGKCACPTTGCWGECNMKRFPLMYTTMSSAIGKNDLIPDGYEVGIRYQLQPVAAPLPAAPAPTALADSIGLELAAISKEIDRQLDSLMDLSESSVDPTTLALAKEVVKVVAERKAAELPELPMCAASYNGGRFYDEGQMGNYARTALARQSSRIRHLERERDMARKDCAALAARQAPDSRDAERYRWLRDKSDPGICAFYLSVGKAFDGVKFNQDTVDCAIDAQIAAQSEVQD